MTHSVGQTRDVPGKGVEGRERLVIWPWDAALMTFVIDAGLLALTAAGLVVTGVLGVWPAALLAGGPRGCLLVAGLSNRMIVDGEGIEVVSLFRRRRVSWSDIARVQASMESGRTLEIVLRGPPEQSLKPRRAANVGGARRRLLVETLNAHASRHGIPSTVTADKLADMDREE